LIRTPLTRSHQLPLVAALAALLLLPVAAEAARRPNPADILANPRALARYLRLTPAQVEQAKALLVDLREEVEPLREQQQPLREELRDLLAGASPAAAEVGAVVIEIDDLGDQIRAAREDFDEAFSAILTAEQLAKYEALKELVGDLLGADD
jgi:Spy/CpxP family protein refolding chaperone